jgi:hypothetical protein
VEIPCLVVGVLDAVWRGLRRSLGWVGSEKRIESLRPDLEMTSWSGGWRDGGQVEKAWSPVSVIQVLLNSRQPRVEGCL